MGFNTSYIYKAVMGFLVKFNNMNLIWEVAMGFLATTNCIREVTMMFLANMDL